MNDESGENHLYPADYFVAIKLPRAMEKAVHLRKFISMLKEMSAAVQAEIKKGRTLDQLKKEKVLAKWTPGAKRLSRQMFLRRSGMTA